MNKREENKTNLRDSEQYVAKNWVRKRWKRSFGLAHGKTQKELYKEVAEGRSVFNRAIDYVVSGLSPKGCFALT